MEKETQEIVVTTIELDIPDRLNIEKIQDHLRPSYPRMFRGEVPRRAAISWALQKAVEEIEKCHHEA